MSNDKSVAASKRAKALVGLAAEREGYVRAGNKARVAEVDAAIESAGGKPPVARRAPRTETAD